MPGPIFQQDYLNRTTGGGSTNMGWLPGGSTSRLGGQNLDYAADIYGYDTQANIALLEALAQLQNTGLQNQGSLDVTRQQGTNALGNTALQGLNAQQLQELVNSGLIDRTKLENQGALDVTQLQGLNAQQLQQLVNSGLLQNTRLENQGNLDITQLQNTGALDLARLTGQNALDLQQLDRDKFNTVWGGISPLIASMFGIDPSTFGGQAAQPTAQEESLSDLDPQKLHHLALIQQKRGEQIQRLQDAGVNPSQAGFTSGPGMFGGASVGGGAGKAAPINSIRFSSPAAQRFAQNRSENMLPSGGNLLNPASRLPGGLTTDEYGLQHMNMPGLAAAAREQKQTGQIPVGFNPGPKQSGGISGTGGGGIGGGTPNPAGIRTSRPEISTGPLINTQQQQQMVNRAGGDAAKAEYAANRSAGERMSSAGFNTQSPAMAAIRNRNAIGRSAATTDARTNIGLQVPQINSAYVQAQQKMLSDMYSTDVESSDKRYVADKGALSGLLASLLGLV